jgi:uncharacterized paraquat-inducible protein A
MITRTTYKKNGVIVLPSLPSLPRQLLNVAQAIAHESIAHLRNSPHITEEQAAERLSTCQACEMFHAEKTRCAHPDCGCHLRHKIHWRSQHCPLGKW